MPRHRRVILDDLDLSDVESLRSERPGQRNAANARERHRMRILSKAFSELKTKLPYVPQDTKLSKLDTLRLATSYIAQLKAFLADDGSSDRVMHPINLTWPFTIQQGQNVQHEISRNTENWSPTDGEISPSTNFHKAHVNIGLMSGYLGHDTSESDESQQSPRHLSKTNQYSDHRHNYSDSLLNIG